jgi:hypothetical protein
VIAVFRPIFACHHWVSVEARYLAKLKVDPELSARCTTTIAAAGRPRPGLSFAIDASFQLVILPRKISASI